MAAGLPASRSATLRLAARDHPSHDRVPAADFLIHRRLAAQARAGGGGRRYELRADVQSSPRIERAEPRALSRRDPARARARGRLPELPHATRAGACDPSDGLGRVQHGVEPLARRRPHGVGTTLPGPRPPRGPHHGTAGRRAGGARSPILRSAASRSRPRLHRGLQRPAGAPSVDAQLGQRRAHPRRRHARPPRGADAVIVQPALGRRVPARADALAAGARRTLTSRRDVTAVVGQHAHVVQPIRRLNGKPVVFGEGNLVSNQTAACCPAASQDGLIALLRLVVDERGARVIRARYLPTWVRHPDYAVVPAPPDSFGRDVAIVGRRPICARCGRDRRLDCRARRRAGRLGLGKGTRPGPPSGLGPGRRLGGRDIATRSTFCCLPLGRA